MPTSLPIGIDQRAAGIAGIDGGVGLDEEAVVVDADLRAGERGDDALSHGLPHAERIADRDDEIADLDRVGIAELQHRKVLAALQFEHGQIRARVAQHDIGFVFATVRERDLHVGHPLDDVVVGYDQPARVDDDAGAQRLGDAAVLLLPGLAEEVAEKGVVEQGIARHRLDPRGVDVDDSRAHLRNDGGEGEMDLRGVLRNRAFVGEGRGAEEYQDGNGDTEQANPPYEFAAHIIRGVVFAKASRRADTGRN